MSIRIQDVCKFYGTTRVVNRVSLDVAEGEFFVLLGPSGSGKSTLLRLIAGLTPLDGGRIYLDDRDVSLLPPQQRGVGFVFQNYALFKHMTVFENVEYGLRIRRMPRRERSKRVAEMLELVGLTGFEQRRPGQLSGGQQQRVALARALAFRPSVLLLDEPFGALDARIRLELRHSVRAIQQEIGITAVFVTHDQEEAFAMGDRIGVMHDGELIEAGAPESLYHAPGHEFTAGFLGSASVFLGPVGAGGVRIGEAEFSLPRDQSEQCAECFAQVLVRPEDVAISSSGFDIQGRIIGQGRVAERLFAGPFERLRVALPATRELQMMHPRAEFGSDEFLVDVLRTRPEALARRVALGDSVYVSLNRVHYLEFIEPLPALAGDRAFDFLIRQQRQALQGPEVPGSMTEPAAHDVLLEADKILVWFGAPRRVDRAVVHLCGDAECDRRLIAGVKQVFASGRPPLIDLVMTVPLGTSILNQHQEFIAAARRELRQLGSIVHPRLRVGDELEELRRAVAQNDTDLLISQLPIAASEAWRDGSLSDWILHQLGPVGALMLIPENLSTEDSSTRNPSTQNPSSKEKAA